MKVALLGNSGQVGQALVRTAPNSAQIFGFDRAQGDLSHIDELLLQLTRVAPDVVINAAAYTAVDRAEGERDLAFLINAAAPAQLAAWCKSRAVLFVHYSTDYVFDGSGEQAWKEEDRKGPLNVYGASKLAGEKAIAAAGGDYIVLRTSWVFAEKGNNFFLSILKLASERDELSVVSDQIGAPTFATHLASATWVAIKSWKAASKEKRKGLIGIFHLCAEGETSWFTFANEIVLRARNRSNKLRVTKIAPILTRDYSTKAKRPLNSRLNCDRFANTFSHRLPSWQEGLDMAFENKDFDAN